MSIVVLVWYRYWRLLQDCADLTLWKAIRQPIGWARELLYIIACLQLVLAAKVSSKHLLLLKLHNTKEIAILYTTKEVAILYIIMYFCARMDMLIGFIVVAISEYTHP